MRLLLARRRHAPARLGQSRASRNTPARLARRLPAGAEGNRARPARGAALRKQAIAKEGETHARGVAGELRTSSRCRSSGRAMTSEQLARFLETRAHDGRDVAFCIGGPDGLAPEIDARADLRWSLSALTLPHALARVMVAEALYRAVSIIKGHPYHRASAMSCQAEALADRTGSGQRPGFSLTASHFHPRQLRQRRGRARKALVRILREQTVDQALKAARARAAGRESDRCDATG